MFKRLILLVVLILIPVAASLLPTHTQAATNQTFYIGAGGNGFLTDETLNFIAEKASMVTLSIREQAQNPYFSFGNIVKRLKNINPQIKILGYGSVTMSNNWERIDGLFWQHLQTYGPPEEFFLHTPDASGDPILDPAHRIKWEGTNYYQMDVRNKDYQKARVAAIVAFFDKYPELDGIFLDETYFLGGPYMRYYPNDQEFRNTYPTMVKAVLTQIKERLPDKIIIFNGLSYDHKPEQNIFTPSQEYLQIADGAAIEFFCGTNAANAPATIDFNAHVEPYLELMTDPLNQNKFFPVYGRGGENDPFSLEYEKETYCLASYLLGKTQRSYFSFFKGIESSLFSSRKFSGMDFYDNQESNLGEPLEKYFVKDGIYQRRFEKGYVLVAPNDLPAPLTVQLDKNYFDRSGKMINYLKLEPGQAAILTTEKVCNHNGLCDQGENINSCQRNCQMVKEENFEESFLATLPFQWFLGEEEVKVEYSSELQSHTIKVDTIKPPFSSENWHALKLDRISRHQSPDFLSFKIRSTDPNLVIRIYLQADDNQKGAIHYPVLALLPRPADFVNVVDLAIASYETTKIIQLGLGESLNNGEWQTLKINLTDLLSRATQFNNYQIHKVDGLYIHGSFAMDDLSLTYGQPTCDISDLNCDNTTNLLDLLHWRKNMVLGNVGTQPTGILGYLQVLRGWLRN